MSTNERTDNIVSRETWLQARRELLALEKAHTHAQDELAAKRRALPAVRIEDSYRFDTMRGTESFEDLFAGQPQLIVYHFMYADGWAQGCQSCSFWADNFDGIDRHLAARNTAFKVVSNASLATLLAYRDRLGWQFDWVSTQVGDDTSARFSIDFGVTFNDDHQRGYNYRSDRDLPAELPGLSVFKRLPDGGVAHTYSTYARGLDAFNGAYHLLDLTPAGRDEDGLPGTMSWLRVRDQY